MTIFLARPEAPGEGVPLAVKDLFDTAGLVTTYGSAIFAEHVPARTAEAVARLEAAGYANVGKTNLHEFAYGITGYNPHFGDVPNPRAPDRTAGGLSAGSAAALVTWGAALEGRVVLGTRDLQRLGAEVDPFAVALLERLGLEASRAAPLSSAGSLYRFWTESPLARQGYPAVLSLWDSAGALRESTSLASSVTQRSNTSEYRGHATRPTVDEAPVARTVRKPVEAHVRCTDHVLGSPGPHPTAVLSSRDSRRPWIPRSRMVRTDLMAPTSRPRTGRRSFSGFERGRNQPRWLVAHAPGRVRRSRRQPRPRHLPAGERRARPCWRSRAASRVTSTQTPAVPCALLYSPLRLRLYVRGLRKDPWGPAAAVGPEPAADAAHRAANPAVRPNPSSHPVVRPARRSASDTSMNPEDTPSHPSDTQTLCHGHN